LKKKILVVDLDGTLYSINTFHYFIKYLIFKCFIKFKIVLLFRLILTISSRLFLTHAKMKYQILKLLHNRNDIDYVEFVNSISKKARDLSIFIDESFDIKILATAAPTNYAKIIAKNHQFHECLGTEFLGAKYNSTFENSKNVKKNNVIRYLNSKNLSEVDVFITDHLDDLPLMKLAKRNILIKPNEDLINQLKQFSISFEVLA
jgi:phosphoserine phosphatase